MYNVIAEKQRDVQTGTIDRITLQQTDMLHIGESIDTSHLTVFDLTDGQILITGNRIGEIRLIGYQIELTYLFFKGHLVHQTSDELRHLFRLIISP